MMWDLLINPHSIPFFRLHEFLHDLTRVNRHVPGCTRSDFNRCATAREFHPSSSYITVCDVQYNIKQTPTFLWGFAGVCTYPANYGLVLLPRKKLMAILSTLLDKLTIFLFVSFPATSSRGILKQARKALSRAATLLSWRLVGFMVCKMASIRMPGD